MHVSFVITEIFQYFYTIQNKNILLFKKLMPVHVVII